MKKTLRLLSLAALTIGMLGSCSKINDRIDSLDQRVGNIENEKIASIENQIAAINSSIADLGAIKKDILDLQVAVGAKGEDISELRAADEALDKRIDALEAHAGDLSKYAEKDWANATFATLEQFDSTKKDLSALEGKVNKLGETFDGKLSELKTNLTNSINSAINGVNASISALEARVSTLEQMIQSVNITPAYSDGSVEAVDGILTLKCIVSPAEALIGMKSLKDSLVLYADSVKVKTKAAASAYMTIEVSEASVLDAAQGAITLTADISEYLPKEEDKTLTVAVNIKNGISNFTTKFVPIYAKKSPISNMKYSKAVYSEEGGAHWEFTMRNNNSESGYPVFILKAGPAYSGEFIEGDFKILSAVLKTSASESTGYKDNVGTVTITCTESGTASEAGKYSFDVKAKDASGNDVILKANGVSTSAKDAGGESITLKDKSASDPTRKAVTGISFPDDYKPDVAAGANTQLSFNVEPTDATNPNAYWTSSDESVAIVDATGNVRGLKEGTATITATSVDGKKTATCIVTVTKSSISDMKYSKAVYSEEGGAHWEFTMRGTDGDSGYPALVVKAGPAYSGEFIEGDFKILSAALKTSASESIDYKDNTGTVTITCTESGTASKAGKYSFDVRAKDASGNDVILKANGVSTSAKDAGGESITLKDKSASDREPVKGISFPDGYKPEVAAGANTQLSFNVDPTDATNPYAYWTSSDESVAIVDATGNVRGLKEGTATITATSVDGKKTATCTVTVTKSSISDMKYSKAVYSEEGGAHWEFTMRGTDGDSGYPALVVKAGPAYSGEFIEGDFKILSAVMQTSATESTNYKDNAGTVTITCTESGTASEAGKYIFDVKAKDASNKDVEIITNPLTTSAKKVGGEPITLKDKSASDPDRKAVTGISFPVGYQPEVFAGSYTKMSFNVEPTDATNPYAYWTSSDETVATVDAYGKVNGVGEGTATITATSVDGKKTATCTVTVKPPVKVVYSEEGGAAYWEFTIHRAGGNDGYPELVVKAGPAYSGEFIEGDFKILSAVLKTSASESANYKDNTGTLTINCTKSGTASKAGKYSFDIKAKDVSDKDVEFTESDMLTRAETTGGVAITLKDKDPLDPAYKAVTGISISKYESETSVGGSTQMSFTVNPSDATNPYVYWTSSDPTVATVDAYGKVKGLKEGTTIITITSVDGKKTDTFTLTVRQGTEQYDHNDNPYWF